jgi:hypothetical protein
MRCSPAARTLMIGFIVAGVFTSKLYAIPYWESTKNNVQFKETTSTNGNTNNLASEGGLGKEIGEGLPFSFVIDDIDNGVQDGLLPDKLNYVFLLTNEQSNAILNNDGIGRITVTAARDIGRTRNEDGTYQPGTEFLGVLIDDVVVPGAFIYKELLTSTATTPPHTENNVDLTKGPNFNTDVTATESALIPKNMMQDGIGDNRIDLALDPTNSVGRLKIKSITLEYMPLPEPNSIILTILGGAATVLLMRRRRFSR